jgi:hypothetical protein
VALQGRSPLTVAGAVTDLAAVAYTLPYSLFIRRRLCALPEPSSPVWTKARGFVKTRTRPVTCAEANKAAMQSQRMLFVWLGQPGLKFLQMREWGKWAPLRIASGQKPFQRGRSFHHQQIEGQNPQQGQAQNRNGQ